MNCGGTSMTWSNCSWAASAVVKAKNSAPAQARNGFQRPKIMIASAVKPRDGAHPPLERADGLEAEEGAAEPGQRRRPARR